MTDAEYIRALAFNSSLNDVPEIRAHHLRLIAVAERLEEVSQFDQMEDALHRIKGWCEAYPLDVFPEPDLKRANEVLEAAGLSLGQISAHAMRHVLAGVQKIVP